MNTRITRQKSLDRGGTYEVGGEHMKFWGYDLSRNRYVFFSRRGVCYELTRMELEDKGYKKIVKQ